MITIVSQTLVSLLINKKSLEWYYMLLNEMFDDYGELILTPTDFESLETYHELVDLITDKNADAATAILADIRMVNMFSTRTVGMLFEDATKQFDVTINQVDGLIMITLGTMVAPLVSDRDLKNGQELPWRIENDDVHIEVTLDDLIDRKMSIYAFFSELSAPITRPKRLLPKFVRSVVDEAPISFQAQLLDMKNLRFELVAQLAAGMPEQPVEPVREERVDERPFKFDDYNHLIDFSFLLNDAGQLVDMYRLDDGSFVAVVPTQDETARALAVEYSGKMMPVSVAYVIEHGQKMN